MSQKTYYRNKVEINGIEPESLWVKTMSYFMLVDDDEHTIVDYHHCRDSFYEVPEPDELNFAPEDTSGAYHYQLPDSDIQKFESDSLENFFLMIFEKYQGDNEPKSFTTPWGKTFQWNPFIVNSFVAKGRIDKNKCLKLLSKQE